MATAAYTEPVSQAQEDGGAAFPLRTISFDVPLSPTPRYAPAIPAYAPPPNPPSQSPFASSSPSKSPHRRFLQLFRSASTPPSSPKTASTVEAYQPSTVPPPPTWDEPPPSSPRPILPRRRSSSLFRSLSTSRSRSDSTSSPTSTSILIGGAPLSSPCSIPSAASSSPSSTRERPSSMYGGTFNVDLRTALVLQEEQNALRGMKEGKEKAKRLSVHLAM